MLKETPKLTALLAAFLLLFQISFAQKTVTGRVLDAQGAGIPGVTVSVKGTNNATQTTTDGSFSIQAADDATLVLTAVGYSTRELSAAGAGTVTLETSASNLNEVVVVGYGTARRRDVTGSVQSVKAKDFNKGVITSPDQAIQGKAAGVMIISNSGQPGGATTVRIRGTSSIRSGQQPLFVIDGVPLSGSSSRPGAIGNGIGSTPGTNPLNFMNPNDIASVEILKDASATAIYGSRGANGVVLITTKRGQSGVPVIEANASAGMSKIMKRLDVLSASEYRNALKDYGLTGGDYGGDVNALDAILRTGYTQNYNAAVGAGNENGRYRLSLNYLDQQGIVKESEFKKFTANLTTNFKLLPNKKLNLDFNIIASGTREQIAPISNDAGFTGSLIGQALQWNPTHPLIKPGTDSIWVNNQIGNTTVNPLAMLAAYDSRQNETVVLGSISPSYKFNNDLEYKLIYSLTNRIGSGRGELKRFINIEGITNRGVAGINNSSEISQQITNTLSYNKQVSSDFNLNALIGHEYLKFDSKSSGLSGQDFSDVGNLRYYDILSYSTQTSRGIFGGSSPTAELQSFFARAITNYKDKLLLTATIRADGSTKFGENNKYGYFPSLAIAYNLSNEDFIRNVSAINNLKIRLGWGRTGNQEFPSGASLQRYVFGQQSLSLSAVDNPDLKWEASTTYNAGVDFSLFGDRIFGYVDYFYKKTTDVLFEQDVAQPGPNNIKYWINLPGNITNNGVEVSLNTAIVRTKDIDWNLGVNASFIKNKVEGIVGYYNTGALHGQGISGATAQRLVSGQPLNVYYLAKYEGIDKTTGQGIYTGGDPSVNKFYVGSPNPKALLGISTDVRWKKFTAYINMNGAFGQYLYNNTANTVLPIGNLGSRNVASSIFGTGVKESLANPITPSTRYLEKGDYLKMANATVSYYVGNVGKTLRNLSVSFTGQNLFVLTDFTGFDPEVNTDKQVGGIPSLGIEYTPYPTARTFLFGVNFSL